MHNYLGYHFSKYFIVAIKYLTSYHSYRIWVQFINPHLMGPMNSFKFLVKALSE